MQNVYKKKGDPMITDSSRGILLADHSGKALAGMVKEKIDPEYVVKMPSTQFGAVPKRGADQASHIVRSAADAAAMWNFSIVVLFLDLVKAFDRVIRELVFGWGPHPPVDKTGFLKARGVSDRASAWIIDYLNEHGNLLAQWKVDEGAAELAESLHAGAWFGVADIPQVVRTTTGGRQGCKLGALTFNSVYSIALDILTAGLQKEGITLRLRVPASPFWSQIAPTFEPEDTHVLDAAFVDDESLIIVAQSGRALDKAIDIMLTHVFTGFENAHLEINTAPGKTEALLKYRGKHSSSLRERRRDTDGKLYLQVPGRQQRIGVVECYEHLGTFANLTGEGNRNALHRCKSAMAAYIPLAKKLLDHPWSSCGTRSCSWRHWCFHDYFLHYTSQFRAQQK